MGRHLYVYLWFADMVPSTQRCVLVVCAYVTVFLARGSRVFRSHFLRVPISTALVGARGPAYT
jgi:hypothetical protein